MRFGYGEYVRAIVGLTSPREQTFGEPQQIATFSATNAQIPLIKVTLMQNVTLENTKLRASAEGALRTRPEVLPN